MHLHRTCEHPLLPLGGSKWKLRRPLATLFEDQGYPGAPNLSVLQDTGVWLHVWRALLDETLRPLVVRWLERWNDEDLEIVYNRLNKHPPSTRPEVYAAEYLFLQRFAYAGKPVRLKEGFWAADPFNSEVPFAFGETRHLLPTLIQNLNAFRWSCTASWRVVTAVEALPPGPVGVLIHAPLYAPERVLPDARWYSEAGAFVAVSSSTPLDLGWSRIQIEDEKRLRIEFLTFNDRLGPSPPDSVFDLFGV